MKYDHKHEYVISTTELTQDTGQRQTYKQTGVNPGARVVKRNGLNRFKGALRGLSSYRPLISMKYDHKHEYVISTTELIKIN
jgi:hypothetical protein